MKLLTSLTAATLAALSVATPAQAYTSDRLLTADQRAALGRDLERANVDLIFTSNCPDDMAGIYDRQRMTLKVCTENIHSGAFMDEVIAHETVHVVQHCVADHMGVEGLLPIHTMLAQSDAKVAHQWLTAINSAASEKIRSVEASAKFNMRGITTSLEREAYALERQPLLVHSLLRTACLGESDD